jgi:virulence-associated protein VapD
MYAVAFDLTVADTDTLHPKGQRSSYAEIGSVLRKFGFRWVQGSLYVTDNEDMAQLAMAMTALKQLTWFADSVRDIRAFRVQQWSDFTPLLQR